MKGDTDMSYPLKDDKSLNNKACDNISPIESCLLSLPPNQFALLSSIFGLILLDGLNVDQKNALGNFIVNIGQAILTAAAQEQSLQNNNKQNKSPDNDQINEEIEELKKQVALLKKELCNRI